MYVVLWIDVMDVSGEQQNGLTDSVRKLRIDRWGKLLGEGIAERIDMVIIHGHHYEMPIRYRGGRSDGENGQRFFKLDCRRKAMW
jgi:hypothetical protein